MHGVLHHVRILLSCEGVGAFCGIRFDCVYVGGREGVCVCLCRIRGISFFVVPKKR